ncbi:hypothetical protein K438DRAFT_435323 [Mycena galopus ATCC 62051]|nr:hypothetical protein K438DRAFT_435323 [Mycena galopus ATCC 62051]
MHLVRAIPFSRLIILMVFVFRRCNIDTSPVSHFSETRTLAIGRDPLARSSSQRRCAPLLLPHPPPPSDDCEYAVAFRSCCAHLFDTRGVMRLTRHPDLTAAACPTHHPSSPTQVTSACNTLARTPCANC